MEVVLAEYAGACYGVQRALDMALKAAEAHNGATSLGPLIHNPQVVSTLCEQGIVVADDLESILHGPVIIRSHGVTPKVMDYLEKEDLEVVDATCPHVMRAQQAAANLANDGYTVLVVGEPSHPEVEGLTAWAHEQGADVLVVSSADDLPASIKDPVGIVVQTTQPVEVLDKVVAELEARGVSPKVKNTICSATTHRQQAAAALAATVDAMVVIGGHNSSNTTRLYEICRAIAPAAYHVEQPSELDGVSFTGVQRIGVSAGASTPENQIAAVVEYLKQR